MTFQDLPLLNAVLNSVTVVLLTLGWIQIKKGNKEAHRKLMTSAFLVSALFLAGYLLHKFTVGPKLFPMQGWPAHDSGGGESTLHSCGRLVCLHRKV
jgi:uncharacterized membrane protein YozB (DUF420 family)